MIRTLTFLACALLPLSLPAAAGRDGSRGPTVVVAGDIVSHRFRQPPWNGQGLASLAELRGKPVLIEFWGTR